MSWAPRPACEFGVSNESQRYVSSRSSNWESVISAQTLFQHQAQQLQSMQAQLQQQSAAMAEMQGQFQRLLLEKQGKVIDNEYAMKLEEMKIQAQLAQAEITTKAQNVSERLAFVEEFIKQQHAQAHEAGMQAQDHAHERGLAQQQQDADSMSQAIDQAHQMGMAQIQQPQGDE